jgi:Protein of unknown function (DUF1638)
MHERRPVAVIACRALEELIRAVLPPEIPMTFMGYELHTRPKDMCPALQTRLDAIEQPSVVLLGYGLCGNGVVGVQAGRHVLVIPRTHDCIAIFLGSFHTYVERFRKDPATFYLTKGWLESGDGPLFDYREYVRDYGEETANDLIDMLYRHYRRLCFVAFSDAELVQYRAQLDEVAQFCRTRLNMTYEEVRGSDALIVQLADMPARLDQGNEEFVVVPPGGEVSEAMFHRAGGVPAPTRKTA